jgi:hypothetical protein
MSHFFEGRILGAFHQIDELTFHLLPALAEGQGGGEGARGNFGTLLVEDEMRSRNFQTRS